MPRQTRDAALETRTARHRLAAQPKPYWRSLEEGLHLGYRKPRNGSGAWLARHRTDAGAYREAVIGSADDFDDADGAVVLSYAQAQTKARAARIERERTARGLAEERRGAYTVAHAMEDYEADFVRRGKKAIKTIKSVSAAHILPALGAVEVARLTSDRLRRWHAGVADAHAMVRSRPTGVRRRREHVATDRDAVRRRRSSANRIMTVLKAALNHAYAEGRVPSDDAWRRVKPFKNVEPARIRSLTATESTRLVNACAPDFRPLARAALCTGMRYGELCRLHVGDVDLRAATVFVAESKSGRPRHVPLTDEGVALFRGLATGRAKTEHVFERESFTRSGTGRGNARVRRAWKSSESDRCMTAASEAARIEPPVTFHHLRHTYASLLVSSGVPIAFVAEALGHADTRITSKHYAHLAPSSVATAIRGALPRFSEDDPTNVVAMGQ